MKKTYQMMLVAPGSDDQDNSKRLIKEMLNFLNEGWEIQRVDAIGGHLLYLLMKEEGEHKNLK